MKSYIDAGGTNGLPRRSLMFIAFGSEELGLVGSLHYCAQPARPLTTIAAMLNFDMVGRMREQSLLIGGVPSAAEWPALLTKHNRQLALALNDCAGCTDHVCFRQNQRPVLWFFTGFHDQYHQHTDDVELINGDGLGEIGDFVVRLVIDLMVAPRAPTFQQ